MDGALHIGLRDGADVWRGSIDEVRLSTRALSGPELLHHPLTSATAGEVVELP